MGPNTPEARWPDPAFPENRRRAFARVARDHGGCHVAWAPDGTRVVAAAATEAEVRDALRQGGIDAATVVFDYIDHPGEGNW